MTIRGRIPAAAVVIAAHNGERHLEEAIESVRQQTLEDIEIVVVDDASSDGTREIVSRIAAVDPRVRYVSAEARSAGAARNIGWRSCQAPFVANLDQDDLAEPERLEEQREYLLAHPDVGLVGSFCHLIDGEGRRRGNMAMIWEPDVVTESILGGELGHVTHSTAMFRRDVLEQLGGYREIPGTAVEDLDIFVRTAERWRVANVPRFLGAWRVHGSNSSLTVMNMLRWTFLVQDAARCRRAGLPDPLEGKALVEPPTDDDLAQLGYTEDDLRRGAFGWHLMWVGLLLAVRDYDGADEHVGDARRYLNRSSLEQRSAYLVAKGRTQFAIGKPFSSVATLLAALALAPRVAGRALAHPVIGGAGRALYRRLPGDGGGAPGRWLRTRVVGRLNRIG
jgi:hypothetical protein